MLFALSAASSLLDGLQSLTSSSSSSNSSSSGQSGIAFDPADGTADAGVSATAAGGSGAQMISPQTLSALIDAQGGLDSNDSADAPTDSTDASTGTGGASLDPLMQMLDADAASSSSVTNSDGSTTTTYADGSTSTTTAAADSDTSNSATSPYNQIQQILQQQAQALQAGSMLSLAA